MYRAKDLRIELLMQATTTATPYSVGPKGGRENEKGVSWNRGSGGVGIFWETAPVRESMAYVVMFECL